MRIGAPSLAIVIISLLYGYVHADAPKAQAPETLALSEWFEIPTKDAVAVLNDRESHPVSFNWEVVQNGDKATARISRDYSGLKWPRKQMDLSAKNRWFERPHRLQRVEGGWLAGYNGGEFGAELWWFSSDGKRSYKISNHHVNQFLVTNEAVYAAEGLIDEGSVVRLSKVEGKWKAETFAKPKIGSPGGLVQVEDGSFIALGGFELGCWTISPKGELKSHEALSKIALPPYFSTAAREGQVIYVGSEYFVMAIDLKTFKPRYLVPYQEQWKKIKDAYKPFEPFGPMRSR